MPSAALECMVGYPYGGPWTGCAVETILRVARKPDGAWQIRERETRRPGGSYSTGRNVASCEFHLRALRCGQRPPYRRRLVLDNEHIGAHGRFRFASSLLPFLNCAHLQAVAFRKLFAR